MTLTTEQIADRCGVSPVTINRWAVQWHGYIGSGHRRTHSREDARVARAWAVIRDAVETNTHAPYCKRFYDLAEAAIRRNPEHRWLLLSEMHADSYPTPGLAAIAWVHSGEVAARIIDLDAAA